MPAAVGCGAILSGSLFGARSVLSAFVVLERSLEVFILDLSGFDLGVVGDWSGAPDRQGYGFLWVLVLGFCCSLGRVRVPSGEWAMLLFGRTCLVLLAGLD
jgi:hypothetical protein